MTIPDWRPEDYYVDFEPVFYGGEKAGAPLVMKVGWVMGFIHASILPDAIKAVRGGGEVSGLLLALCVVDYLAGYFCGHKTSRADYAAFMQRYFPPQYEQYLAAIYDHLRSGLVHNLSLVNPWVPETVRFRIEGESDLHLQLVNGELVFSIRHFVEDTRRAEVMYVHDLVMKPDENPVLIANFHRRFNRKGGAASMMEHTVE